MNKESKPSCAQGISSAELARLLHDVYLKWNKENKYWQNIEGRVPLAVFDELGLDPSQKHAHSLFTDAINRLPIKINETSYEWLLKCDKRKTIGDLKKVSTLAGYWRCYNRECRQWWYMPNGMRCLDPKEFVANVTYTIHYDEVQFNLERNVILGYLPPGFVKRIFGWSQLEYVTTTFAIYDGWPTLHEEGKRKKLIAPEMLPQEICDETAVEYGDICRPPRSGKYNDEWKLD